MTETIDTLTMARKLGRAVAGGDEAVLTPAEASALHDMIAPAVEALIEHKRGEEPAEVPTSELQLVAGLGCTMAHKLALRYDAPDKEMNELFARSLEIVLNADVGEERALAFVANAMARPVLSVRTVLAGREAKAARIN